MSDTRYVELTVAEANALKAGIELGRGNRPLFEKELELMKESLGIDKWEEAEGAYMKALEELLMAWDPGDALDEIDKSKSF